MASLAGEGAPCADAERSERRFFLIMAIAIATIIVAGFATNLALGRSTFAVPWPYHLHAAVFFGWVALYVTQHVLIAGNNIGLHKTLGWAAMIWAPLMVVLGLMIMVISLRRTGGPFFFDQNEFLFSNPLLLTWFMVLVLWALKVRRYSGWHRRLMLSAMTVLVGPGLGRLLPMPLLIPHAWRFMVVICLVFPLIGMIRDKLRRGSVHPAYWWGVGGIIAVQVLADVIAYSALGVSLTEQLLAGTPGAERPMHAFLPPGFAM